MQSPEKVSSQQFLGFFKKAQIISSHFSQKYLDAVL